MRKKILVIKETKQRLLTGRRAAFFLFFLSFLRDSCLGDILEAISRRIDFCLSRMRMYKDVTAAACDREVECVI